METKHLLVSNRIVSQGLISKNACAHAGNVISEALLPLIVQLV